MNKLNLSKELPKYYKAKKIPEVVELDASNYISISGVSAPEDPKFLNALEAIYPVAYSIKYAYKAKGNDFVIPKMEAFWWVESGLPYDETPRNEWYWEVMIQMPSFVANEDVESAIRQVIEKKQLAAASEIYFKNIPQRKCCHALHIGSYENEAPTLERLHGFIQDHGFQINGYHNEIYITDPRRTPEERLKTILRYEVK